MALTCEKRPQAALGIFALGLLLLIGSSTAQEPEKEATNLRNFSSSEIKLDDLEFLVTNETGIEILKAQFHEVPEGPRSSSHVGTSPENMNKNRYEDLPAYDATRVVLEKVSGDDSSDYINANYINGYYRNKEYVATQGPLNHTINDFWRMVWQLNSDKIVMLANIIEHGKEKVAKYWPETNQQYGNISVTKLCEYSREYHVIRTFALKNVSSNSSRTVRHFHFTGWPDMGVPSDRLSLVSLMVQARKHGNNTAAPIIVHCSAGVGRTGTMILMDSEMQRAQKEGKMNYPKRLDEMRDQRINVVEKEDQYIFAHAAVNDALNKNGTDSYLKQVNDWYEAHPCTKALNPAEPDAVDE